MAAYLVVDTLINDAAAYETLQARGEAHRRAARRRVSGAGRGADRARGGALEPGAARHHPLSRRGGGAGLRGRSRLSAAQGDPAGRGAPARSPSSRGCEWRAGRASSSPAGCPRRSRRGSRRLFEAELNPEDEPLPREALARAMRGGGRAALRGDRRGWTRGSSRAEGRRVRIVANFGVGVNNIDLDGRARRRGWR